MPRALQRLVALALAAGVALNFPLLSLFDRATLVFGVPVLWCYLFVVWAVVIGLAALALERAGGAAVQTSARHHPSSAAADKDD